MQRWIVAGIVAFLFFCGLAVGGWFAYRSYKDNRPAPVWVPVPVNPELPMAKCDEIVGLLKDRLGEHELLVKVSKDTGLVQSWGLPSDDACAAELGKRIFVRMGQMDTPMGKTPAIHVGLSGKRKERELSGKIAIRLMDDALKVLGIEPPQHKKP